MIVSLCFIKGKTKKRVPWTGMHRAQFIAIWYAFLWLKFKIKPMQEIRWMLADLLVFVSIENLNDYSTADL